MSNSARVSFEVSVDEHIAIKIECAKAQVSMKDFLHAIVLSALKDLKKKEFLEKLKKSIQQAKEGKVTTMTLHELEEFVEDEKS